MCYGAQMTKRLSIFTLAIIAFLVALSPVAAADWDADWGMNEHRGSTLHDLTGHGLTGHIGGHVRLNGSSHGFSHIERHIYRPGRIDVVPDYPLLDPEDYPFTVKARFKWPGNQDNNIVQKGQGSPAGGMFKMKTSVPFSGSQPPGHIKCLFRGSTGDSQVESYSHKRLDDNLWHTVTCTRNASGTVMKVDGVIVDRNDNDPGTISNDWPVSIGGNSYCDAPDLECNYWYGRIDYIKWDVKR
jgi:hypothetical protein